MNLEDLKFTIHKYIYDSTVTTAYNSKHKEGLAESAMFTIMHLQNVVNKIVNVSNGENTKSIYITIDNIRYSAGHMLIYANADVRRYLSEYLSEKIKEDNTIIKRDMRISGDGWGKAIVVYFDCMRYI